MLNGSECNRPKLFQSRFKPVRIAYLISVLLVIYETEETLY